ncbi:MAG: sugar ABC transporter permease [Firmicutes bacterium]|nr:sugar ABC transporter permease [Bacillota bacterium]
MAALQKLNAGIIVLFLTIISLIVIYPLLYVIASAFTPGNSIADMPIVPFTSGFTLDNFTHLFNNTNYPLWFMNTLQVAVATSIGTMFVASLGAYTFSRFRFAFKKTFMVSMLVLQVFPSFIGMIAIFVILFRFGLLDNLWGLVLVYLAGNTPFNTWLMKSYLDTIPRSMDEAARIDGASHLRTFLTIIMPMAKPIIIFLLITSFTGPWMDFILPQMVLRSPANHTLAMGLFSFITDRRNDFTTFAAGSIIIAVPFVVFFVATQKMLITSLGAGAVKE